MLLRISGLKLKVIDWEKIGLTWNTVENAGDYLIERSNSSGFELIDSTLAGDTVYSATGLEGNTLYSFRVRARNESGSSPASVSVSAVTPQGPGPFKGTNSVLPGKIEAEDFDLGPDGISWHDLDPQNQGGAYRSEGPDIEACKDAGGGFNLGYIYAGEYLVYTCDVTDSIVDIDFRLASSTGGKIRLELDGTVIGSISFKVTGGWQVWNTQTLKNVHISPGNGKKLKLVIEKSGFNLNSFEFRKSETGLNAFFPDASGRSVSIYPNPSDGALFVSGNGFMFTKIEVFDLSGKIVYSCPVNQTGVFRLEPGLPAGSYLLKVSKGRESSSAGFILTR